MAFNWSTFWTRAFTALIFVAVMMLGLLCNQWTLFALISVIYFGCSWEYFRLVQKILDLSVHLYCRLGAALLGYHLLLFFAGDYLEIGGFGIRSSFSLPFLVAGIILLVWGIFKMPVVCKRFIYFLAGSVLYTALPLGLLLNLAVQQAPVHVGLGQYLVLFIFGSLWINDTMAYLSGSVIGRTPLSKISPKKTWEGTISGIILSAGLTWLLFSLIFFHYVELELAVAGMLISLVAAISGTFGDLFESKLKRMAGVKDSGRIMPGHGGFLDRFDSVLFAAPAVWLLVRLCYS